MKKRILCGILAFLMLLFAIPTVSAAQFSDIDGHWGKDEILAAVELGLFTGTSSTEFTPNGTMTRGMFVTVLGRLEGLDTTPWTGDNAPKLFSDVPTSAYYAPYVAWAACNGIVDGMGNGTFAPDAPVTREQMAKLVGVYASRPGFYLVAPTEVAATEVTPAYSSLTPYSPTDPELPGDDFDDDPPPTESPTEPPTEPPVENPPAEDPPVQEDFSDEDQIAGWALPYVEMLCDAGIFKGSYNSDGSLVFLPKATATRAEGAAVFCRIHAALQRPESIPYPTGVSASASELTLNAGGSITLSAEITPPGAINSHFWVSSNPAVASVTPKGKVTAVGRGTATVTVYTGNALKASCTIHVKTEDIPTPKTHDEKCKLVFGEVVNDPRLYYSSSNAAQAAMTDITVATWDLDSKGNKFTRHHTITVHKNLAPQIKAVFEEIYNGVEKFPIYCLLGFVWSGKSEHSIGCAIDINFPENYFCQPDGTPIVGNYWKPGEDPYSIPPGGDVVRAFEKYGFRWGVYWNNGTKDYMHFSYFGT